MDKEKLQFLIEHMELCELLEFNIMLNKEILSSVEYKRRLEEKER